MSFLKKVSDFSKLQNRVLDFHPWHGQKVASSIALQKRLFDTFGKSFSIPSNSCERETDLVCEEYHGSEKEIICCGIFCAQGKEEWVKRSQITFIDVSYLIVLRLSIFLTKKAWIGKVCRNILLLINLFFLGWNLSWKEEMYLALKLIHAMLSYWNNPHNSCLKREMKKISFWENWKLCNMQNWWELFGSQFNVSIF